MEEKPWNYKDDLCIIGARDLYLATGDAYWNTQILDKAHWLMRQDGTVANWAENESNIDKVSFGKSLRILQELTDDPRYAAAVQKAYKMLEKYPRTNTGNFWHKDIYPNQVWLDGLYMGMPFYAQCLLDTGDDHWDDIIDQFVSADLLLWDSDRQLYMHACDCSGKAEWANPVTGKSPAVWLRAEGWFLMALCDTYELAKEKTSRAEVLSVMLKKALDGILAYQVPQTKMLLQVVDRQDLQDNYSETSGSAMVAYALMKGARLGMIAENYGVIGSEMLDGIRDTYLKAKDGKWGLHGI
ncbi:MAG: glycoside hydrolase family 88 protein, partial [Oscillospiraceae bacterium]|nr:glycoside hydrolase family 88 protein [Oscillospiraceae bacterium]